MTPEYALRTLTRAKATSETIAAGIPAMQSNGTLESKKLELRGKLTHPTSELNLAIKELETLPKSQDNILKSFIFQMVKSYVAVSGGLLGDEALSISSAQKTIPLINLMSPANKAKVAGSTESFGVGHLKNAEPRMSAALAIVETALKPRTLDTSSLPGVIGDVKNIKDVTALFPSNEEEQTVSTTQKNVSGSSLLLVAIGTAGAALLLDRLMR